MTEAGPQHEPEWYRELGVGGRRWPWWGWIPVAAVFAAVFVWWALHPDELPREEAEISISVKAGQTAYVGVIGREAPGDRRDIDIREVSFDTSDEGLEIEALICRNGAIASTTEPEQFCGEVVEAEGSFTIGGNDQLMVKITGTEAGTITVNAVEVSYREGLQFGTTPIGPRIVVFVVG